MYGEVSAGYAAVSLHALGQVMACSRKQHHFPAGQASSRWTVWSVMTGGVTDAVPNHSPHALTLLHPGVKAPGTPNRMPAGTGKTQHCA